jgi:hypothetical protein
MAQEEVQNLLGETIMRDCDYGGFGDWYPDYGIYVYYSAAKLGITLSDPDLGSDCKATCKVIQPAQVIDVSHSFR